MYEKTYSNRLPPGGLSGFAESPMQIKWIDDFLAPTGIHA